MNDFVQIGNVAFRPQNITSVIFLDDDLISVSFGDDPNTPSLEFEKYGAMAFLKWWENTADVYRAGG